MADMLKYGDKGPRVKELQKLLNKNAYRKARRLLDVDGEFGPLTASAINGTKYWMGYPRAEIQPVAGDLFFDLLTAKRPLPPEFKAKRDERLKKAADNKAAQTDVDKMRIRALGIIKEELGTLERPNNSNHIKYNDWWGWGPVPYCVIGVSWAWVKAGSKAFAKGSRWAGTDLMLAHAAGGDNGIHLTHEPEPGCPGVIDFDGHSNPDHAITFVHDNGNGTCETYEFNTSKDSTYIQGVWRKDRPLRNCWWFEVEE